MNDLHTKWITREPSVAWIVDGPKPEVWVNDKLFLVCSTYKEATEILKILLSTCINPITIKKLKEYLS